MIEYKIVIDCSITAYDLIYKFLMNSHHVLPTRHYKNLDRGYFYYEIESIDCLNVETINALYQEADRLKKNGEYVVINSFSSEYLKKQPNNTF